MPTYSFTHQESGETIDLYLDLKQPPEAYRQQVRDGKVFKRVYEVPGMSINSIMKDDTKEEFARVTDKRDITVGQMAEVSKEMSVKRAAREGSDAVQEVFYKDYEKRIGVKHKDVVKRERLKKAKASLKKYGVTVKQ